MAKKVLISADSTCDLSPELVERYGIRTIPMYVNFGNESFADGVEMTPDELYRRVAETNVMPHTSCIPIGVFTDYFRSLREEADAVIHISLSSELSSCFQNALLAAEEVEGVYAIDSRSLSTGGGLSVLKAADYAAQGMEAEEIIPLVKETIARINASFVIDSLEYLRKGGRCSSLVELGANLLQLKPCIELKDGKMHVGKKYRGKYAMTVEKYLHERLEGAKVSPERCFITHAGCAEELVHRAAQIAEESGLFKEVFITRAGCTISSHCGANTLGVLFENAE